MHDLLVETNAYAIDFFCLLEYLSNLEAELDLNHHYKKYFFAMGQTWHENAKLK